MRPLRAASSTAFLLLSPSIALHTTFTTALESSSHPPFPARGPSPAVYPSAVCRPPGVQTPLASFPPLFPASYAPPVPPTPCSLRLHLFTLSPRSHNHDLIHSSCFAFLCFVFACPSSCSVSRFVLLSVSFCTPSSLRMRPAILPCTFLRLFSIGNFECNI